MVYKNLNVLNTFYYSYYNLFITRIMTKNEKNSFISLTIIYTK